ncbi:uncharacterized protein LOC112879591 isoform X2 [Panicum hallii]|uniref:uncharacterized protein LOC112879591 isoform X2 n=1 Tax=Panicum hallii TaxID=206008 RepID=UPI000DF4D2AB|nr:uncharacterized protein LOC112879591 isoform X2 [Panicum hallii]
MLWELLKGSDCYANRINPPTIRTVLQLVLAQSRSGASRAEPIRSIGGQSLRLPPGSSSGPAAIQGRRCSQALVRCELRPGHHPGAPLLPGAGSMRAPARPPSRGAAPKHQQRARSPQGELQHQYRARRGRPGHRRSRGLKRAGRIRSRIPSVPGAGT